MRIDYSEPKKSCGTPLPSQNRPRKESSGGVLAAAFISGILCLGIGFGSGWMLSQRSAKKGFKAAMEQQSLENSPKQAVAQPAVPPTMTSAATPQQPAQQPAAPGAAPVAADPQLSFYKTLPSGQKNNALGSGINSKEEKSSKQPLQAAMPTNLTRPSPPQNDENVQKKASQNTPARATARNDTGGLTVQVASYSLKSEAETMRGILAAKGYNVGVVESRLGDKGTWYRVRVGKHLEPEAAKELAKKLGKGAIAIPEKE